MEDRVLTQIPQVPAEDKGLSAQVIPAGQMLNKANRALFCLANSRTMINAFFVFYISFSVWMTLHDFQFCASGSHGGKFTWALITKTICGIRNIAPCFLNIILPFGPSSHYLFFFLQISITSLVVSARCSGLKPTCITEGLGPRIDLCIDAA